jgi:hypothetical protein
MHHADKGGLTVGREPLVGSRGPHCLRVGGAISSENDIPHLVAEAVEPPPIFFVAACARTRVGMVGAERRLRTAPGGRLASDRRLPPLAPERSNYVTSRRGFGAIERSIRVVMTSQAFEVGSTTSK